jgi:nitrogen fixation/metabolism regulation signal transduction histidine kinase
VVLLAAGLGASVAGRIADPVARLTRATRQIAAGDLDVRIAADTADELRRLVDDFNSMAETLVAQRAALARTNQIKAWNEMARQVAHEIKNPLTPIQLAAEHLQHVHEDRGRPLGRVMDQCLQMILGQVRLLRQIASEFSNFAGEPTPRPEPVDVAALLRTVIDPYRQGLASRVRFDIALPAHLPSVWADRTLLARAFTNLVENAVQAMPEVGHLAIQGEAGATHLTLRLVDTGVGMDEDAQARAFEPFFSTKTGGSGLGLANARRNIEVGGGSVTIESAPGRGTTVTVILPLASDPDETAVGPAPSR